MDLQREPDGEAVVVVAGGNTNLTTIRHLNDDVLSISLALLGGIGHFRYSPLACKLFLKASENIPHFKKITTGESVTSSVSCVQKYFEDEGTGKEQLMFFWVNAIRYGRVNVMQWANQQRFMEGTHKQIDSDFYGDSGAGACAKAAEYGHLLALQWLKANGCDWDKYTCRCAARDGHLHILQWARENGCDWDSTTCSCAALHGHLHILQWARENGCAWDKQTCSFAALSGHLSCLQWARANGCDWDEQTCEFAALNCQLHTLQWARENGCPWNSRTCNAAARGGHLFILQWARENGCDWDSMTCSYAAGGNHLSCLQWARENGCPDH
jgi:hypothetical protein